MQTVCQNIFGDKYVVRGHFFLTQLTAKCPISSHLENPFTRTVIENLKYIMSLIFI